MAPSYLTKRDVVAEWIRTEILSGSLPPGTPLLQDEIAQRLDVSPTPVREAFRALVAEGLLRSRPHHGVVVGENDFADMTALYELRTMVETAAFTKTLAALTPRTVERLRESLTDSAEALERADLDRTRIANVRFHQILLDDAGTQVYADIGSTLISRSRYFIPLDEKRMSLVLQQHRGILEQIEGGSTDKALATFKEHMAANLTEIYQARGKKLIRRAGAD